LTIPLDTVIGGEENYSPEADVLEEGGLASMSVDLQLIMVVSHQQEASVSDHPGQEHGGKQSRFSEGQEESEHSPDSEHRGDFAEGQEGPHHSDDLRRGDFAEGQEEESGHDHAVEGHGDFAKGHQHD
jgi:hypothetical protein